MSTDKKNVKSSLSPFRLIWQKKMRHQVIQFLAHYHTIPQFGEDGQVEMPERPPDNSIEEFLLYLQSYNPNPILNQRQVNSFHQMRTIARNGIAKAYLPNKDPPHLQLLSAHENQCIVYVLMIEMGKDASPIPSTSVLPANEMSGKQ